MMQWLRDYWPIVAFVLAMLVFPFVKWVVGQLRKGLASHDDLQSLRIDAAEKIASSAKASADAAVALEARLNARFDLLSEWVANHNVAHAKLDGQMDQLRQTMEQMPTAAQITNVLVRLTEVQGDIKAVQRTVDQIDERVLRHEGIFSNAAANRQKVSA
ncbi:DUF2730 family protein [Azospirillum agricola]|uniref:DUF2730 family protein n=1 Tax=Azospirillum agricola TaxID=1720247 RepID=UPI000A0F31A2|nr:DUF2730 family protein [Azospirillum agricola]SMH62854.1 Protein of unknown function [Azospirillum lipoferum]